MGRRPVRRRRHGARRDQPAVAQLGRQGDVGVSRLPRDRRRDGAVVGPDGDGARRAAPRGRGHVPVRRRRAALPARRRGGPRIGCSTPRTRSACTRSVRRASNRASTRARPAESRPRRRRSGRDRLGSETVAGDRSARGHLAVRVRRHLLCRAMWRVRDLAGGVMVAGLVAPRRLRGRRRAVRRRHAGRRRALRRRRRTRPTRRASTSATALDAAIDAFVADPNEETLEAAKQAWLTARDDYGLTEAFRFYGGPIDDEETGRRA